MAISREVGFRFWNLLMFLIVILFNALGYFLPLGSTSVATLKPSALSFDPLAQIIWIVIYGLMLIFIIYQLLPFTYEYDFINSGITWFFTFHCLANVGWILAQAYTPENSLWIELIFIYAMLLGLSLTYVWVLRYIYRDLKVSMESDNHFYVNYFFGRIWISVYLGWIVTLACVDSFSFLTDLDWNNYVNASITFGAVGLLALILLGINRDLPFGLTILWSCIWLAIANYKGRENVDYDLQYPIFASAITVGCVVALGCILTLIRNIFFMMGRVVQRRAEHVDKTTSQMNEV